MCFPSGDCCGGLAVGSGVTLTASVGVCLGVLLWGVCAGVAVFSVLPGFSFELGVAGCGNEFVGDETAPASGVAIVAGLGVTAASGGGVGDGECNALVAR
jgi:hypothetical protein